MQMHGSDELHGHCHELSEFNFGGRLSHTDGLYITVTVFPAVGSGDITAKSQPTPLGGFRRWYDPALGALPLSLFATRGQAL